MEQIAYFPMVLRGGGNRKAACCKKVMHNVILFINPYVLTKTFREFNILTVYSLYILESAKFVKKYPDKFSHNMEHPETNIRVTRNTTYKETADLFVKTCSNANFGHNPLIMLARIWNHLPENIKSIENVKPFTNKLKKLLLQYMFYDMHEFFSCKFDDV